LGDLPGNSLAEIRMHDPLVMLGFLFTDDLDLRDEERLNILNYSSKNRHLTHRKLWSGEFLKTTDVLTNIEVFPEYRLAYAEKYLLIKNISNNRWDNEEALYTFYLPEGAVATSMSLWINGKEEKSRLTTRKKADSAYLSIVGYQQRDPALLHWQEGNRVTVTVFPCTSEEDRKLKVGFTMPLPMVGNKLILENMNIEGPDFSDALETTVIRFTSSAATEYGLPRKFKRQTGNSIQYTGKYNPDWKLEIKAPALSNEPFSFNGKTYTVHEFDPVKVTLNPQKIYLDVNRNWSKDEFDRILKIFPDKSLFVFYDSMVLLTPQNKDEMFEILSRLNFSLFPVYEIKEPNNSLLISKSNEKAPNLTDLKESIFTKKLQKYLSETNQKIPILNLGEKLSPYLKTLKEFGVFNYFACDQTELAAFDSSAFFPASDTTQNSIIIDDAHMVISSENSSSEGKAPDHIMRIFAYNQILKLTGKNYFTSSASVPDELIDIANEAYVVTPFSSLIILENKQDYDQFKIKENNNSLQNASVHSPGAAPEPHEWALIGIIAIVIVSLSYRRIARFAGIGNHGK
jgi:XrtN system VIT domain protein